MRKTMREKLRGKEIAIIFSHWGALPHILELHVVRRRFGTALH
jgi:hypothetical protein